MSIQPFATASAANAISASNTNGDADVRRGARVQRVGGFQRGGRASTGFLLRGAELRRFGASTTIGTSMLGSSTTGGGAGGVFCLLKFTIAVTARLQTDAGGVYGIRSSD